MDPTERAERETFDEVRRQLIALGVPEAEAAKATEKYDTKQLQEHFTVQGFLAPFVSVTRKSDGKKGVMMFTHHPRWYFNFDPED